MKTSFVGGLSARRPARQSAWLFLLLLFLAGTAACDRLEGDIRVRRGDIFHHDGSRPHCGEGIVDSTEAPVVIPSEGLFVTAVSYPDGYDWRRDTARGNIRGHLLLLRMRDWTADKLYSSGVSDSPVTPDAMAAAFDTVLALEAGAGRPVSLDPDRHQFSGGHLYTQCISEAGTVYRRDGRTVFLSQEREYLRGILTLDDTVGNSDGTSPSGSAGGALYTLSQRLDGEGGFVLRRNWKPLLIREGGRIHGSFGEPSFGRGGALFADGGKACFFYEKERQWLLVRDGKEESITLPDGITQLYDIRCFDGVICLVCRWKQREPVLFVGSKKYDLSTTLQTPAQKSGFRLLRTDAGIRISGSVRMNYNQRLYTVLWSEKSLLRTLEGRCDWIFETSGTNGADSANDLAFVRKEDGRVAAAGVGHMQYTIENGGTLMMPQCAYLTGDRLYLALTGSGNVQSGVMAGLTGHLGFPVEAGNDGEKVGGGNDGEKVGGGNDGATYPILWINGQSIPLPLNGFPTSVTLLGYPPN